MSQLLKPFTFIILMIQLNFSHAQVLFVQGDVVNIRSSASTSGAVVVKAKRLDELTLIKRAQLEVVNGIEDYWYFVRTNNGKEGYVFGQFTSLKREGQRTEELILNEVSMGDCYHLIFGEIDFGSGKNDLGDFEAISDDETSAEPRYIGKRFRVTYNELYCMQYPMCNPDLPLELAQVPTILKLQILE